MSPPAHSHLVGIGEVNLPAVGDAGRAQRGLPSADDRVLNGEREKEIGFADVVVVEKVCCIGAERVGVEDPAVPRDGHAELCFLVALAVQRDECEIAAVWRTRAADPRR